MFDPAEHLDPVALRGAPVRELIARAARLQAARDARTGPLRPLRIALLGGFTTSFVAKVLDLFLLSERIDARIYEAPYGSLAENVLNPGSELYRFDPELVLLLVHHDNLIAVPPLFATLDDVAGLVQAETRRWEGLWSTLLQRSAAQVVQSTFDAPLVRPLGNLDASVPYGRSAFVARVNLALAERLPAGVSLFDFATVKSEAGLRVSEDLQSGLLHGQPFRFDLLGRYCFALGRHVAALLGLSRKCLVLDLDDTLWGGVVGDDGVEALVLGSTSPVGAAFVAFQRYVRALRERGVVLAVCSKNEEATARAAFETHPEMVLGLDDIACFVANWEDKAANLRHIAQSLNLGLDALVFADDNPRERHRIRLALPEVAVVELPDDPAGYVLAVEDGAYFEVGELTAESALRGASYVHERQRREVQAAAVDYASYLDSLGLQAEIEAVGEGNLPRAAELEKRTNQWNLRTRRFGSGDLKTRLARPGAQGFCVRLQDGFGDYGIVSFVLLERRGDAAFIATWLMSCRVFNKTVELLVFEELVERARASGATTLLGEYRPTAKNAPVRGLFGDLGFTPTAEVDGVEEWSLALEPRPSVPPHHIERMSS